MSAEKTTERSSSNISDNSTDSAKWSTASTTSSTNLELLNDALTKTKISSTFEPVPYSPLVSSDSYQSEYGKNEGTPISKHKKVSIIGCGQVGLAIAYSLINQELPGTLALVDVNGSKLEGEAKDLQQGSAFHERVRIKCSTSYDVTAHSHLVIVTAGSARKPGDTRLDLLSRNISIMKVIIPEIIKYSPHTSICVVSNPVDVMTAIAAKIAGPTIPPGRIFGSGTCLDSSRLRSLIGHTFDIDTSSIHGYIIGEHGESCVPVWSSVTIGGVPLLDKEKGPTDVHTAIHREVIDTAADVIVKKGYTNWAIGLSVAFIVKAILNDTHKIIPISTCVRGFVSKLTENDNAGGSDSDHASSADGVYLSLPCVIGSHGVKRVINLPLTDDEKSKFINSVNKVWSVQKDIWDTI